MVFIFSLLLIGGMLSGQFLDLSHWHGIISFITSLCLSYIMIEVGIEFSVEKRTFSSYGLDTLIATGAALFPALLWIGYFLLIIHTHWQAALLAGLSSAPTSAGVLFAMMSAAGLGATWVFQKARILAVLDDLVAVLLLTPLEIVIHGFEWKSLLSLVLVGFFIFSAFRWQNGLKLPLNRTLFVFYSFALTAIIFIFSKLTHIHLEVLIPAFAFGCVLRLSPDWHGEAEGVSKGLSMDTIIKGLFMFMVGLSLPKIETGSVSWGVTAGHIIILTVLANLGKFFLVFCYKKEASLKERMALGVAMFPRGEVGAAVLLIGVGYGLSGFSNTLAILSLALNLVLTGAFIWIVIKLLRKAERDGARLFQSA